VRDRLAPTLDDINAGLQLATSPVFKKESVKGFQELRVNIREGNVTA